MFKLRLISALITVVVLYHADPLVASVPPDAEHDIAIRYGHHSDYLRIVLEGPHDIISSGNVTQKNNTVRVSFADHSYSLNEKKLPIKYERHNNELIFHKRDAEKIKLHNLSDPSRLVIDFYAKKEETAQKAGAGKNSDTSSMPPEKEYREENIGRQPLNQGKNAAVVPDSKKEDLEKASQSDQIKGEVTRRAKRKVGKKNLVQIKEDAHDTEPAKKPVSEKKERIKKKINNDTDIVPEHYRKLWTLLETGNYFGLLSVLPEYRPESASSVAIYHYMYGAASYGVKHYLDAIDHLRLAYIYSDSQTLKEMSLALRAKAYMAARLYQEARADYKMLIETFPDSGEIRKAHLGLADSLSKLGLYSKAVTAYEKAGSDAEVLFSKANALQQLERVKKAHELYEQALLADDTYPDKSRETYYLLGENMRMTGQLEGAREHLSKILSGPYKDSAQISLGLISLKEGNVTEARNRFIMATNSHDRRIKISGIFNLALTSLTAGKIEEATEYLETIRHDYVDSYIYKDTILALAKIYRKAEQTRKSLSLLKELVYGKQPPQEAFNELERIILDSLDKNDGKNPEHMNVAQIWKEVGQWLVDDKREEFLVTVVKNLRGYGMPFIELSGWLIKNGSQRTRGEVALNLADYYADIGELSMARMYISMAVNEKLPADEVLRVEVQILNDSGKRKAAMEKLVQIRNMEKRDVLMLGKIIFDIRNPQSSTVAKGISFYKELMDRSDWDAEIYMRLADILDIAGRGSEAMEYYRIAHEKNPDDEWAIYRIGRWSGENESEKMYSKLQDGDSLLSRVAKTELTGINILNKVNEVF